MDAGQTWKYENESEIKWLTWQFSRWLARPSRDARRGCLVRGYEYR